MKQATAFTILTIVIIAVLFTTITSFRPSTEQNNQPITAGTENNLTTPALRTPTTPVSLATATSTLYNPATIALPGSAFPCEYQLHTVPTPTIPGAYSITPDKEAGIGNVINKQLHNYFMKDFETTNIWSAYINGTTTIVYAGHRISNPREGGIFIQWGHPGEGQPIRPYRYHPTREQHGTLHVINANEVTIELEAQDGTRFHFNVCDEVYVEQ